MAPLFDVGWRNLVDPPDLQTLLLMVDELPDKLIPFAKYGNDMKP